jgi:nucleoside-diphosphate-sugar epimerase
MTRPAWEAAAMKVFVTAASGAIGCPLLERLAQSGHKGAGMARPAKGAGRLRRLAVERAGPLSIVRAELATALTLCDRWRVER